MVLDHHHPSHVQGRATIEQFSYSICIRVGACVLYLARARARAFDSYVKLAKLGKPRNDDHETILPIHSKRGTS